MATRKPRKTAEAAEAAVVAPTTPATRPRRPRAARPDTAAKDAATARGEPYVAILTIELDPDNVGNGAFELDWNDKFITNLVRAGYQSRPNEAEDVIVDRWFQSVCRNVAMENFEQWEVNQPTEIRPRVIDRRDAGDGRIEIS